MLFVHCCNVYNAMFNEAHEVAADADHKIIVYEGHLTKLITQKLNLSVPYYSSVRKALMNMGCIRQLQRGGGTQVSQWELFMEPTWELYEANTERKPRQPTQHEVHDDMIQALTTRIADLEEWQENVNAFLIKKFGLEEATDDE